MRTYDEITENVLEAVQVHRVKVKRIRNAVSVSALCAVCVAGVGVYAHLEKPVSAPPASPAVTDTAQTDAANIPDTPVFEETGSTETSLDANGEYVIVHTETHIDSSSVAMPPVEGSSDLPLPTETDPEETEPPAFSEPAEETEDTTYSQTVTTAASGRTSAAHSSAATEKATTAAPKTTSASVYTTTSLVTAKTTATTSTEITASSVQTQTEAPTEITEPDSTEIAVTEPQETWWFTTVPATTVTEITETSVSEETTTESSETAEPTESSEESVETSAETTAAATEPPVTETQPELDAHLNLTDEEWAQLLELYLKGELPFYLHN